MQEHEAKLQSELNGVFWSLSAQRDQSEKIFEEMRQNRVSLELENLDVQKDIEERISELCRVIGLEILSLG